MKRALNRTIVPAAVLILAAVCGYLLPSGFSSSRQTAKQVATGRSHSVIYRVRESRPGQPHVEKIVLRSVNEKGEWRKETIWPAAGSAIENRLDGTYGTSKEGKSLLNSDGIASGYFQALSEKVRQTAEVKEIAGLKAYVLHGERGYLVVDDAYADETGRTPLWSRIVNRETGFEVESEALHVIWGVKDF
jgi:hypothetical protein